MRKPTQGEFLECWSETIIRNGILPVVVDDPLFRKSLVITSRMGQTTVCMGSRNNILLYSDTDVDVVGSIIHSNHVTVESIIFVG